jgi:hypothetical protein
VRPSAQLAGGRRIFDLPPTRNFLALFPVNGSKMRSQQRYYEGAYYDDNEARTARETLQRLRDSQATEQTEHTKYREEREETVTPSITTVASSTPSTIPQYRKVTRVEIYKALASSVFYATVVSLLMMYIVNGSRSPINSNEMRYLAAFGFPALFSFLFGWATRYRRLAFLTGTLFGFSYLCGVMTIAYIQYNVTSMRDFWYYILPLTIGGAFFATLGASIRARVEYPRQKSTSNQAPGSVP